MAESPITTTLVTGALIIGATIAIARFFEARQLDAREPPAVHTSIPYFGHVFGLIRSSLNYFLELRQAVVVTHS